MRVAGKGRRRRRLFKNTSSSISAHGASQCQYIGLIAYCRNDRITGDFPRASGVFSTVVVARYMSLCRDSLGAPAVPPGAPIFTREWRLSVHHHLKITETKVNRAETMFTKAGSASFKQNWAKRLVSSADVEPIRMRSLEQGGPTGPHESEFFARCLSGPMGIKDVVPLLRRDASEDLFAREILLVLSIGTDLNSHSDSLHGGAIATLLDEVMSLAVEQVFIREATTTIFTIECSTKYLKPAPAPGDMLCRARLIRTQGRRA